MEADDDSVMRLFLRAATQFDLPDPASSRPVLPRSVRTRPAVAKLSQFLAAPTSHTSSMARPTSPEALVV